MDGVVSGGGAAAVERMRLLRIKGCVSGPSRRAVFPAGSFYPAVSMMESTDRSSVESTLRASFDPGSPEIGLDSLSRRAVRVDFLFPPSLCSSKGQKKHKSTRDLVKIKKEPLVVHLFLFCFPSWSSFLRSHALPCPCCFSWFAPVPFDILGHL